MLTIEVGNELHDYTPIDPLNHVRIGDGKDFIHIRVNGDGEIEVMAGGSGQKLGLAIHPLTRNMVTLCQEPL